MILNALCEYYDLISKDEKLGISPFGFQKVSANYVAILTEEGILHDIISLNQLNDNKPQSFMTPHSMKKSSIAASPVCDNFEYIFGVGGEKGTKETAATKHQSSKKLHLEMFGNAKSPEAVAIVKFFEKWDLDKAWENENILKHYTEKGKAFSGNIVFRLLGKADYFHDNKEIIEIWTSYNNKSRLEENNKIGQCSITGEIGEIVKLHKKVSGIRGASTMGASLVCFNKDSDESYGLKQSQNSAVSQKAEFKYTTALQYMLSKNEQHIYIGDATTVFWAGEKKDSYTNVFKTILNNPDEEETIEEDIKTREAVKTILQDGGKGLFNDPDFDVDTKFYILGLSPNAGRTSIRFFYQNSFFTFCERIKQHYDDISIYGGKKGRQHIKIGSLLYATINSKSKDKQVNPLLGGALTRAILTGEMYPQILIDQTIMRIKSEKEVTQPRAAIIKGFLIRKNRILKKEEELSMSLNEKSTNPAYVLGRTFSILEMIQKNALGEGINATIKDKYFASACSNPALVFPNLLKLAQHHLAKIQGESKGGGVYWSQQLGQCLGLLEDDSFPKTLNMENQGRFILGYYQQTQKNYEKRSKEEVK